MANPLIDQFSNSASVSVGGADANGNAMPLSSLTATIDSTTNAYLTVGSPTSLMIWKRSNFTGTKTVTITFNAKSQDGSTLPAVTYPVDMNIPVPPQATQVTVGGFSTHNTAPAADPGTAAVTMI